MSTTIQPVTAEQLLRMPDDGFRYELIKGELKKMSPAGNKHGYVIMNVSTPLDTYVKRNSLGRVYTAETGFLISSNPDTVRAPDVAFVSQAKLDELGDMDGFLPCAPDLVVEVVSPSDSYAEVEDKVSDWLAAGSRMVVVVYPRKRSAKVYRSAADITVLMENDILDGGDVVPGWSMALKDIFA